MTTLAWIIFFWLAAQYPLGMLVGAYLDDGIEDADIAVVPA